MDTITIDTLLSNSTGFISGTEISLIAGGVTLCLITCVSITSYCCYQGWKRYQRNKYLSDLYGHI